MKVLLIEDDRTVAVYVADLLFMQGIICEHAFHGEAGINLATENVYDVIVLDLILPDISGLKVCKRLRRLGQDTPVIMVTAKNNLSDKLAGFSAGADDYLCKPFAIEELAERIRVLAQRRSGQSKVLRVGELELDLHSFTAKREGVNLKLTPTGWQVLETLMRAYPAVVSREHLERVLWQETPPDSNSLKVHLCNLRQQLDKPFGSSLLKTVPKLGFKLTLE